MKNQITYTEHNGLYYPDLALPEQTSYPLGRQVFIGIGNYPIERFENNDNVKII